MKHKNPLLGLTVLALALALASAGNLWKEIRAESAESCLMAGRSSPSGDATAYACLQAAEGQSVAPLCIKGAEMHKDSQVVRYLLTGSSCGGLGFEMDAAGTGHGQLWSCAAEAGGPTPQCPPALMARMKGLIGF